MCLHTLARHASPRLFSTRTGHRGHSLATSAATHSPSILASNVRTHSIVTRPLGTSLFDGKPTNYSLETSTLERISQLLAHHRLNTWGFVIYRCTYDDDAAWARFMKRLERQRNRLPTYTWTVVDPDDPIPWELMKLLTWRVQEDRVELDGASKDEVRRRHRQLVSSHLRREECARPVASYMARQENPRWNFCVHVDKAALESVLHEPPPQGEIDRLLHERYVNLIRTDSDLEAPDYDRYDWSKHKGPEDPEDEDDPHDDNEEQIDGSRLYDVGWTKVQVDDLIPSLYDDLIQDHN